MADQTMRVGCLTKKAYIIHCAKSRVHRRGKNADTKKGLGRHAGMKAQEKSSSESREYPAYHMPRCCFTEQFLVSPQRATASSAQGFSLKCVGCQCIARGIVEQVALRRQQCDELIHSADQLPSGVQIMYWPGLPSSSLLPSSISKVVGTTLRVVDRGTSRRGRPRDLPPSLECAPRRTRCHWVTRKIGREKTRKALSPCDSRLFLTTELQVPLVRLNRFEFQHGGTRTIWKEWRGVELMKGQRRMARQIHAKLSSCNRKTSTANYIETPRLSDDCFYNGHSDSDAVCGYQYKLKIWATSTVMTDDMERAEEIKDCMLCAAVAAAAADGKRPKPRILVSAPVPIPAVWSFHGGGAEAN
eukprot:IDg13199t1